MDIEAMLDQFNAEMGDAISGQSTVVTGQQSAPLASMDDRMRDLLKRRIGFARQPFNAMDTDTWRMFTNKYGELSNLYDFVKNMGYSPPPLKNKATTFNYLIGVIEDVYYCPRAIQRSPVVRKRSVFYYSEILKLVDKPLGYHVNNLPPNKYLRDLLFTVKHDHLVFKKPTKGLLLPFDNDNGFYHVPTSLRGLVKVNKLMAAYEVRSMDSRVAIESMKSSAEIIQGIGDILNGIGKIEKEIKKGRLEMEEGLENFVREIKRIIN